MNNPKRKRPLNTYAKFSSLAIQMFAIIGIASFAGVKLDKKYPNKNNLFTLVLSLLGVLIAIFYVIRQITISSKENENNE